MVEFHPFYGVCSTFIATKSAPVEIVIRVLRFTFCYTVLRSNGFRQEESNEKSVKSKGNNMYFEF